MPPSRTPRVRLCRPASVAPFRGDALDKRGARVGQMAAALGSSKQSRAPSGGSDPRSGGV